MVGSRLLMSREGIPLGEAEAFSDAQMRLGKTVVFVAEDDEVIGRPPKGWRGRLISIRLKLKFARSRNRR